MTDRLVAVGVPVPGLGRLTYRVPESLSLPPKGARVSVPLSGRTVLGCVIDPHAPPLESGKYRDVVEVLDSEKLCAGTRG